MKQTVLVSTLLLISFCLRLINLGSNPVILNRDEAALGYNALLLDQTGMDEWQQKWPLTLQSFGDYKLIGYPTLVVGVFKLLGYSDLAVRLPSAVAGVGVLLAIYLVVKRITQDTTAALFTLALAALTPIFFFYSRIAFEANVGLLYLLIYLVLLLRKHDSKTILFDGVALLVLIAGIVTYNTPLLLAPFIGLLIPVVRGITNYKHWLLPTLGTLAVAAFFFTQFAALTAQKEAITIFSDPTQYHYFIEYRNQFSGISQKLLGNQYIYYGMQALPRFWKSFSPEFLVTRGGSHPWHAVPGWGHLLLTQYLLFIGSLLMLLGSIVKELITHRKKVFSVLKQPFLESALGRDIVLIYILVSSLLPAAITVDSPHATRSLLFMVFVFVVIGVVASQISLARKTSIQVVVIIFVASTSLFAKYLRDYFIQYPQQQALLLQANYPVVLAELEEKYPSEPIAVVNPDGYQYILTAWYLKMPAADFFASVSMQNPDRIGFRYGERVGRYRFIKEADDHSQEEKVIVEWDTTTNTWQIKESS